MNKLLFLALICLSHLSNAQVDSSLKDKLIDLNKSIFKEYVLNHNTTYFSENTTDDFMLIAVIGQAEDKNHVINGVKNVDIKSVEVSSENIIIKEHMAIVSGVLKMEGTVMGNPVPGAIRYMSVFILENDTWKLQARTMTPIRRPGIR